MGFFSKGFIRWLLVIIPVAAVLVFTYVFFIYNRKPEILSLNTLAVSPGDRIILEGRNFGEKSFSSKLFFGNFFLTSSSIIEWSNTEITARVPRFHGAVLVKVKTSKGFSNGMVLGDAQRFPQVNYGAWLPGSPYAEYTEPAFGEAGTFVVITGENFGNSANDGSLWINRNDNSTFPGTEHPDLSHYIRIKNIKEWTDSKISFWVPQNAASGNIYIFTGERYSNPVPFEIVPDAGEISYSEPFKWSIRQKIKTGKFSSYPDNNLYLYVPSPAAGTGQEAPEILERALFRENPSAEESSSVSLIRKNSNLYLYRISGSIPGSKAEISRQIIVPVLPVSVHINKEKIRKYDPGNPETADALAADKYIRPDLVPRTAARITKNIYNIWDKSRAVYNYVVDLLNWSDNPPSRVIPEYISTGKGDSRSYSFLFCSLARAAGIPARPVGGILVLSDLSTVKWWWSEIWIEGVGWIPVDAALGDNEQGFSVYNSPGTSPENFYFGSLEGAHIAFSRGILSAGINQPSENTKTPDNFYSLQSYWEEYTGNIDYYKSEWLTPEVSAVY